MESLQFQKIAQSPRTPEGYRLATLQEAKSNFKELKRSQILGRSDIVRVLNGCIRIEDYEPAYERTSDYLPKDMLVVRTSSSGIVLKSSAGLIRKDLYSNISLDPSSREVAFDLSFLAGDIEVIYWLLADPTSRSKLKQHFQGKKECAADPFSEIVKLFTEDVGIGEHQVKSALDYALESHVKGDPVTQANYALSIVEFVLDKCDKESKGNIVSSGIDRLVSKLIEEKNVEAKQMGILTKLLSECEYPLKDRDKIIGDYFGRLLKEAAFRGYVSLVKELLRLRVTVKGELVNEVDADGKTVLHYAAEWERSLDSPVDAVSESLFEAYSECFGKEFVKRVDSQGRSVVHLASLRGRAEFCKLVMEKYGIKVEAVDNSKENLLHHAAKVKDGYRMVDKLGKLLQNLVVCKNKNGQTPLHQALLHDNTGMVSSLELFLKREFKEALKAKDYSGQTPLHLAACHGNVETVTVLLNAGADPFERDNSGKTALHHAVRITNSVDTARKIVDAVLTNLKSDETKALLLWVSAPGIGTADQTEGLDSHLENFLRGKKLEISNSKGVNVFKAAAIVKNARLTWELLNRGADIAKIPNFKDFIWVRNQVSKFSEQVTDQPTRQDTLGRDALVECIAAHFLNSYVKSPITVSISGESGSGKTSLMNQIEAKLLTTAAQVAFPYLWEVDKFCGAKDTTFSKKGKKMCYEIGKGVSKLLEMENEKCEEVSLAYLLNNYEPKYKDVYKSLACMDFDQLLETSGEEESVFESDGQILGAVPRVLTVNFNAGNYRGRNEAWAGLALDITKEIEASMTPAQLLSTRWKNNQRRHSEDFYLKFIFPALLLVFVAVWIGWAAWKLLDRVGPTEFKDLKYGSIPLTIIGTLWSAFGVVFSYFKPVSTQLSGYFSKPNYSHELGYQQKVIDDIMFLKGEIGKKPMFIFSFIAGEKCNNWWGILKDNIKGTSVPKYGSAPKNKLLIVAFVDDLDHCEESVILEVLWAIKLVFKVCQINVIFTVDKNTIQKALQNSPQNKDRDEDYVDKYISKLVQLPVNLPDPADDQWENFLHRELGRHSDDDLWENFLRTQPDLTIDGKRAFVISEEEERGPESSDTGVKPAPRDIESGGIQIRWEGYIPFLYNRLKGIGTHWEGCIPFLYNRLKGILLHYILPIFFLELVCNIRYEPQTQQTQHKFHSPQMAKSVQQFRETLMVRFTEEEIETFDKLKSYVTGNLKLPRDWKCYLNYHKFARNAVYKQSNTGKSLPLRWQTEFVVWTFVCSQWKKEMNILIQDWYKYIQVKDHSEVSLKKIVVTCRAQRKGVPGDQEYEAEEERWQNAIYRLNEKCSRPCTDYRFVRTRVSNIRVNSKT